MKYQIRFLTIMCIILMGMTYIVGVSADYGLEWGFEVGNQFHFRKSGTPLVPTIDYYVEIDSIPFDPGIMTNLTYEDLIAYVNFYSCYYEDGSEMEQPEAISVLPIGNWSYFEDYWNLTSSVMKFTEWINTDTEWGFIVTLDSSYGNITTTMKFSKSDGVMTLRRTATEPKEGIATTTQTERRYPETEQLLSTAIMIGVGVGIVALVIVGVAVKFRRN